MFLNDVLKISGIQIQIFHFHKSGKSRHHVVIRTFKRRFKRYWEILLYNNQMIWNHFSIFPSYLNNEIHNTGLEFLADKLSSGDAPLNIHAFKIIFNIPNSLISQSFNHSFYTLKIHFEVCLTPWSKFSDNPVSGFVSALITFSGSRTYPQTKAQSVFEVWKIIHVLDYVPGSDWLITYDQ